MSASNTPKPVLAGLKTVQQELAGVAWKTRSGKLANIADALAREIAELEAARRPSAEGDGVEHELIERLLDAQQDINLAANSTMDQSLANASALIDEIEPILRAALQPPARQAKRPRRWRARSRR